MFAWLGSINKAWVAGVVAFICQYIVLQFFHLDISADTQTLIVTVVTGLITAIVTWAVPNVPAK